MAASRWKRGEPPSSCSNLWRQGYKYGHTPELNVHGQFLESRRFRELVEWEQGNANRMLQYAQVEVSFSIVLCDHGVQQVKGLFSRNHVGCPLGLHFIHGLVIRGTKETQGEDLYNNILSVRVNGQEHSTDSSLVWRGMKSTFQQSLIPSREDILLFISGDSLKPWT